MLDKTTITLILLSVILAVNLFTLKSLVESGGLTKPLRPLPVRVKPIVSTPVSELKTVPVAVVKKPEIIAPEKKAMHDASEN